MNEVSGNRVGKVRTGRKRETIGAGRGNEVTGKRLER